LDLTEHERSVLAEVISERGPGSWGRRNPKTT
jgi:hypothetical protein